MRNFARTAGLKAETECEGRFYKPTNCGDERQNMADDFKRSVRRSKIIGWPTNIIHLLIALWSVTYLSNIMKLRSFVGGPISPAVD